LVFEDVEPRLGVETGVVVAGLDDWGHVEGVAQSLQGLIPDVDRVTSRVLKVKTNKHAKLFKFI
jgi:hypothetical protein